MKHRDLWGNFFRFIHQMRFEIQTYQKDSEEGSKIVDKLANEALDESLLAENIDKVVENDENLKEITFRSINKVIFGNKPTCKVCRKYGTQNVIEFSKCRKYIDYVCTRLATYQYKLQV